MEYSTREKNIDVEQVVTKMIQCAMDHRKIQIANIIVKSCRLKNTGEHGCAFAAIALW